MSDTPNNPGNDPKPPEAPTLETIAAQLARFEERFDGLSKKNQARFAELEGRLSPSAPVDPPKPTNGKDANGGNPVDVEALRKEITSQIMADLQIGQARERMPEEQRERFDAVVKTHGARAAAAMLDLIAPPSQSGDPGANPPRGRAAMPSTGPVGSRPKTVSDLIALKAKDPKSYEALMAEPGFSPSSLENR